MKGLTNFIVEIRKCKSKEEVDKVVFKELGKIRTKFSGRHLLSGYHKKKYLCKLIYIFFLGHKFDEGRMEAVNLLSSNTYSEKKIGYLFISLIMDEESKFTPLIINSLKDDLNSSNQNFQNLALQFISNNANTVISSTMFDLVFNVLNSNDSPSFLRQTAALTFLRLLQLKPSLVSQGQFLEHIVLLLSHHNVGLVTAVASLVDWMTSQLPTDQCYSCVPPAIIKLNRIVSSQPEEMGHYIYYGVPAPWLLVKLLRILRKFPAPSEAALRFRLKESLEMIMENILTSTKHHKSIGTLNAGYAVIFEAIATVVETEIDQDLLPKALGILTATYQYSDSNFRLVSLEIMTRLSDRQELKDTINTHWNSVIRSLRSEGDVSMRKMAIDLIYTMCDESNLKDVSAEMIHFLRDEHSSAREDIIAKLSSLVSRFQNDLEWYVNTVFETLLVSEDSVDEGVWYLLVKIVAENPAIHAHAAKTAFTYLSVKPCPDIVAKVAGYILGEFGHTIASLPTYGQVEQLDALQSVYPKCSGPARALLLTTFMKFLQVYPEQKKRIQSIFRERRSIQSEDVEIQKRAVEYLALSELGIPLGNPFTMIRNMPSYQQREISFNKREDQERGKTTEIQKTLAIIIDEEMPDQPKDSFFNNTVDQKPQKSENVFGITPASFLSHEQPADTGSGGFEVPTSKDNSFEEAFERETLKEQITPTNASNSNCDVSYQLIALSDESVPPASKNAFGPREISKPLQATRDSTLPLNPNLMYQPSGILYDDAVLRVLLRKEFNRQFGTLFLMYTNKSELPIENFTVRGNFAGLFDRCQIWFKPECLEIAVGGCVMQNIHVECLREFANKPSLSLKFQHQRISKEVKLLLPLTMQMFIKPCRMPPGAFLDRWNHLKQPEHEATRTFPAKFPMMCDIAKAKVRGLSLAVVDNVFPPVQRSPDVVCGAGMFHSRSGKVGFLVVLECHLDQKRYKLAVRSEQKALANCVSNLLYELL